MSKHPHRASVWDSPELHSALCARMDKSLSIVILATEYLRAADELGEAPVALGGLSIILDDVCHELVDIRNALNPGLEE